MADGGIVDFGDNVSNLQFRFSPEVRVAVESEELETVKGSINCFLQDLNTLKETTRTIGHDFHELVAPYVSFRKFL